MNAHKHSHLPDHELLQRFTTIVARDNTTTADLLSVLGEVDHRKLFRPAGYPSMFKYCVRQMRMSEDVAYKRIRVARAARQFPAIYKHVAAGRLHLSGLVLLTPHLQPNTAQELLESAALKSRAEIELLLAQRFPQSDVPTVLRRIVTCVDPLPAEPAVSPAPSAEAAPPELENPPAHMEPLAPGPVVPSQVSNDAHLMVPLASTTPPTLPRARLAPLSSESYALQVTLSRTAHDLLREAQALLGHALPAGDISQVLERALGEMVQRLRKRKFGETSRPRAQHSVANGRHIPAAIRRAVVARDEGRCTFVNAKGKRCDERTRLEFDHEKPISVGGETTVENLRLRCRAHNQYAAEYAYGEGFMGTKRGQARHAPGQQSTSRM